MHLFDRQSANRLIPEVEQLIKEVVEKRREMARLHSQMHADASEPGMLFVIEQEGDVAHRFNELDQEIYRLIQKIMAFGVVIKDFDMGLVDFPAIIEREAVYLCWRLGEREVRYYHGVDEGFYGRRPLPDD